jgi:hypothetical protein
MSGPPVDGVSLRRYKDSGDGAESQAPFTGGRGVTKLLQIVHELFIPRTAYLKGIFHEKTNGIP